jgi:hypothetical protein
MDLRIAPHGQGSYKPRPTNNLEENEEVWPLNTNALLKSVQKGNVSRNLRWANKPSSKVKMDGGRRGKSRSLKRSRSRSTRRKV